MAHSISNSLGFRKVHTKSIYTIQLYIYRNIWGFVRVYLGRNHVRIQKKKKNERITNKGVFQCVSTKWMYELRFDIKRQKLKRKKSKIKKPKLLLCWLRHFVFFFFFFLYLWPMTRTKERCYERNTNMLWHTQGIQCGTTILKWWNKRNDEKAIQWQQHSLTCNKKKRLFVNATYLPASHTKTNDVLSPESVNL